MRDRQPPRVRRRHREEWRELVRVFRRSGQTPEDFARAKGLHAPTLRRWVAAFRSDPGKPARVARAVSPSPATVPTPRFVPVQVTPDVPPPAVTATTWELHLAGGHRVCVHAALDPVHLRTLIETLAGPSRAR